MKIPWKWLWSVMLVGSLLFTNLVAVEASDSSADLTKKGSITVALQSNEKGHDPIAGGNLALYKVADVSSSKGLLEYTYTTDFAGCKYGLEDLQADSLATHIERYALNKAIKPMMRETTSAEGCATFEDLEMALYLVRLTDCVSGYQEMEPFLVSLPMTNAEGTGWMYDVTATPKLEKSQSPSSSTDPSPDPSDEDTDDSSKPAMEYKRLRVEKCWSDANAKHSPVKVTLYKDNAQAEETITLGVDGNWTYEWTQLDANSDWYVLEVDDSVPEGYAISYDTSNKTCTKINNTKKDTTPEPSEKPPTSIKPSTTPGAGSGTPLIQTGQLRWPIPVLAVAGILLASIGWVLRRKHDE